LAGLSVVKKNQKRENKILNKHTPILFLLLLWQIGFTQGQQAPGTSPAKPKKLLLEFSQEAGYFEGMISLRLHSSGARIFYTLDGNEPSYKSAEYEKPIVISRTTVVRAIAIKGKRKSNLETRTFFIDEPKTTFPTISIAVPPDFLFDPETGLYVNGPNTIDSLWKKDGANFWSRREIEVNTELFETDGHSAFNSPTGFRLFGGMSRLFPQKSMTIIARDRYGKKKIKHKLYGKDGLKEYKFMVLRNAGSDWGKTHFRDAFMISLVDSWDIEKQDSRPAHVYLNGKYWGIYNIREKVNRHFIADHHDLDKDSIDLIEHQHTTKVGSRQHYLRMLKYMEKNDLSDPAHYAYIQSQMDVENFMQYQIAQIYFDNQDAGGNIKFWRPQTENGKWRWILYDTDWGFGLHDKNAYKHNSLAFHTEPNGPSWPNPVWSTFILRQLLKNESFRKDFVNRFADELNSNFSSERVEKKIDEFFALYEPEIDRQIKRWNLKKKEWQSQVNQLRTFGQNRPDYVRLHLMEKFDTGRQSELHITALTGGTVVINNNIRVTNKPFKGHYFEKIPVNIKAVPNYGYRFVGWKGIPVEDGIFEANLLLRKRVTKIEAIFEPYIHPLAGRIMINEISANNKKSKDWIELYNNSDETVNLKDWNFTDTKHHYHLPDVQMAPKEYLILTEDQISFNKVFPNVFAVAGNFPFGLNKRIESVSLYAADGALIDSIAYQLPPTDSTITIGLLLPHLDNSDLENWEIIRGEGTPNAPNPYYLMSHIHSQQNLWMRIGAGLAVLLLSFFVLRAKW
jgi:CotH kinase protein/Lamin Tail Domain/Chitobiase/beta-hexosaminidase C-terminal domain